MIPIMSTRDKIFVSYSHEDDKIFKEFTTMLAPVIRTGLVDLWSDRKISTGARWEEEIQEALAATRIAVLLVSPHFLASPFIAGNELPPLLEAAEREGVTIFWIYLSSCLYGHTEIALYQAAHDISRPLDCLPKAQRRAVLSASCAKLIEIANTPTTHVIKPRSRYSLEYAASSRRILLVEDERTAADTWQFVLQREGFQVDVAYDGETALAKVGSSPPDLLVLDWELPGISGLDVLCEVRRNRALTHVLALFLTGKHTAELDMVKAINLGADGYLLKPAKPKELVARIDGMLRRSWELRNIMP
jgi:CheY-like chemotaxis protein